MKPLREFASLTIYVLAWLCELLSAYFEWLSDSLSSLAAFFDPEMDKARREHDEAMRHIKQRLD